MPAPYQAATAAALTGLAYPQGRHIEQLCDGSYLALVQTTTSTLSLVQITSPSGTPTFTTLTQTFTVGSSTNTIGDIFILNNGTTTSDVWVVWDSDQNVGGIYVAHGTYTASGASWSWDNTSTTAISGAIYGTPSICWTGTYLVIATRVGSYSVHLTATTTKNGSSGWSTAIQLSSTTSGSSHYFPILLHDATNACTLAVYTLQADHIVARVIADASAPGTLANWSAEVTLSTATSINVGAANLAATLDAANSRLHVAYLNSSVSTNPYYVASTYTTTSITAGTPFSVDSAAGTVTGVTLGLDAASPPNVWLAWATGAAGSAADIEYAKIASPYTSASAATNLTNNTANDNAYPNLPRLSAMSGYAPLLYAHAVSPWAVEYDNSIAVSGGALTGAVTFSGQGSFSADGGALGATFPGQGSFSVTGVQVVTGAVAFSGQGSFIASPFTPGTGIGDITRSSGTQYANKSGNGYGTGDISGIEYDYIYKDASGSGWAVGANPWYGGMPVSAQYQLDPTLNTTLPQKTTQTGNLHSLLTTQSGGTVHWEEYVTSYQSSELLTFANTGNFTELAPASTPFRAYLKAIGDTADANGFSYQATVCIYPGDPGLMVYRFDQTNNTASTISPTESDIQLIASLVGDNGANPTGAWNPANAFYGTIGAAATVGWPTAGAVQSGTLDYTGVTPDTAVSALSLGIGAAVIEYPTGLGWPANGYVMNENGASATIPTRIKFGFSYGPSTAWNITAGQTHTFYVLRVLRRSLTSGDMAAIAADFKYPGTPSVVAGSGSFTAFNVDERAYEFAANATTNTLNATLDLSPANVTVRYKPVMKVSSWTGGAPILSWGGSALAAGSDYRYYNDTTTSTLYLQLYFDVVTTGAVLGQRNNAALLVQPGVVSASVTFSGDGSLSAGPGVQVVTGAVTFPGDGALAVTGLQVLSGAVTFPGHGLFAAGVGNTVSGAATFTGEGSLRAGPGVQVITASVAFSGAGALVAGPGVQVVSGAVAFTGEGAARMGPALLLLYAAVTFSGAGLLRVALAAPPIPVGVSVATGGAVNEPAGASVALAAGVVSGVSVTGG